MGIPLSIPLALDFDVAVLIAGVREENRQVQKAQAEPEPEKKRGIDVSMMKLKTTF